MPNIQTYDAPDLALRPSETGVESTAAAARRGGAFYNSAGEAMNAVAASKEQTGRIAGNAIESIGQVADVVDKYEGHKEISHGMAVGMEAADNMTNSWKEFAKNTDPNDPSVAAKFRETVVEPTLQKFVDGFQTDSGQKWAEEYANKLRQHMFTSTAADMATRAGEAFQVNVKNATTHLTNTAYNDPSSVPFLLATIDHNISALVDSSPNLSAADAANAKTTISADQKKQAIHAGAQGAIRNSADPEATAAAWAKKYPDQISGPDQEALAKNARSEVRARNSDYETNRKRDKEVTQDQSAEATNQYIIDVRSQDPKLVGDPTAQKVLNDPKLTKQDKNNLLNLIDRQLKPETESRISQQTFVGLLRELRAPDADPDKIMQKAWDARLSDPGKPGSLNDKDFNQFRQELIARKTPEGAALERDRTMFFKNYAPAIVPSDTDPRLGDPALYAAEQEARKKEQAMKAQGKDPSAIYDPSSPDFFGKTANIARFNPSMQDTLKARLDAAIPKGRNPAGQGEQVISVTREDKFAPPANWLFSASRKQFKDPASGKVYDVDGKEVK